MVSWALKLMTVAMVIVLFVSQNVCCEDKLLIVFCLNDDSAKKIVAVSTAGKIEYVAIKPNGDNPGYITKGELINKVHIILNNNNGVITLNYISCVFGVSFAIWGGRASNLARANQGWHYGRREKQRVLCPVWR